MPKQLKARTKLIMGGGFREMPRRPSLFWDVDPKIIDPKKHARYIIERILEFGTDKEVRWLWRSYSRRLIREVAQNSRVIHPQTRILWEALTLLAPK